MSELDYIVDTEDIEYKGVPGRFNVRELFRDAYLMEDMMQEYIKRNLQKQACKSN